MSSFFLWWILDPILFIAPCWAGNISALLARRLPLPETPLDFGFFIAEKPLFGPHKTWRGLLIAIIVAGLVGLVLPYHNFTTGAFLGFSAMLGDLAGAGIKRRIGVASGMPCLPCDRIPDTLFPIVFAYVAGILPLSMLQCIILLIGNIFISKGANIVWYVLRLKEHPW